MLRWHGPVARRRVVLAAGGACFLFAVGAEAVSISRGVPEDHLLDFANGGSFLAASLLLIDRRPGNRLGPLLIAAGFTAFCGNYSNLGLPLLTSVLIAVNVLGGAILPHLALAYPTGRVETRLGRVLVAYLYGQTVLLAAATLLTWSPRSDGCVRCIWTPAPWYVPDAIDRFNSIGNVTAVVLAPLFGVALWQRWRRSSRLRRRELAPMWPVAALIAGTDVLAAFTSSDINEGYPHVLFELQILLQIGIPVLVAAGLLSARFARAEVAPLVVALQRVSAIGELEGLLRSALRDPSVRLLYTVGQPPHWVTLAGEPADLPAVQGTGCTIVRRDGSAIAAVVHDPATGPDLVDAVAAAAGLAIENERLHAELRSQLDEVRASRARIVTAGDAERHRLERDLHDGAQQQLLALSATLAAARRDAARLGAPAMRAELDRAASELLAALTELRELARGIHPAILTESGLAPALIALARRAPLPVTVTADDLDDVPPQLAATAYYLVSEALTNTVRHGSASSARVRCTRTRLALVVEVSDDGVGGADPARGTGLRGLEDRLGAVGGHLTVVSDLHRGTVLRAEIPVAESVADDLRPARMEPAG